MISLKIGLKIMNSLSLPKEIYNVDIIYQACLDFERISKISINSYEFDKNYTLVFSNCKYSIKETIAEFENYLINLQVKSKNGLD